MSVTTLLRRVRSQAGASSLRATVRRPLAIGAVFSLVATGLSGAQLMLSAPFSQAEPGSPGVPAPGTAVFTESFDTAASTPMRLSDYVGAGGARYTADAAFSPAAGGCDGWILNAGSSPSGASADAGCASAWPGLRAMAQALGQAQGLAPATNNVVVEHGSGTASDDDTMLSLAPTRTPVLGHSYAVSVWLAAQGCGTGPSPSVTLSLVVDQAYPLATDVDPCTAPGAQTIGDTTVVRVQSAPMQVTVDGSQLGVSLSGAAGAPLAFDGLSILDVSPQLDVSFVPPLIGGTEASTMTLTITNTDDLAVKSGWSFIVNLPDGLDVPDAATPSMTCVGQSPAVSRGPTQLLAHGTLPAGAASCSVTVPVVADVPQGQTKAFTIDQSSFVALYGLGLPAPVDLTADEQAPAAPVIVSPADGVRINDATPTISGTGESGTTLDASLDGVPLCSVAVGADGAWSCPVAAALTDGPHTVTATLTDAETNVSATARSAFTIDASAPDPPVVTSPADGSAVHLADPAITGTGVPGATVTVSEGTATLCSATVADDGSWSCSPASDLSEGEHAVQAVQTVDGHDSNPDAWTFAVSTTTPDPPSVRQPIANMVSLTGLVTFSGLGVNGDTVTVSEGDATLCSGVVAVGRWSCTVSTALPGGPHTVTATQTDPFGRVSAPVTVSFSVARPTPLPPSITEPDEGDLVATDTPTFAGLGAAGSTVTVSEGGTVLCSTPVADDGWSCAPRAAMAQGEHTVDVVQTDASGETSPSASVAFTIDSIAPAAPTITTPGPNALLASRQPSVSGTGEPGATVTVSQNGQQLCQATVGEDDSWTCTPDEVMADGPHTYSAAQTDAAGNESGSTSVTFTISSTGPDAPDITGPVSPALTNDPTPTIRGTGEAGDTVSVTRALVRSASEFCSTTVSAGGTWVCTPALPLSDGVYSVEATQTDALGRTSPASRTLALTIDATAPDAPRITGPVSGALLIVASPTITGTGEPGAQVTVSDAAQGVVCVTTVPVGGVWSCAPDAPLADGTHALTAEQADRAGNVSAASPVVRFQVDVTPPSAPVVRSPAADGVTADPSPTITGQGEPGATVTVALDGATVCQADVSATGVWACAPEAPLGDGEHVLSVTQRDSAGYTSAPARVRFSVDTAAPVAALTVTPFSGQAVTVATPTISGTGAVGYAVSVSEGETPVCGAVVGADGAWSCVPSVDLADGDHELSVVQSDTAGVPGVPVLVRFTVSVPRPSTGQPSTGLPSQPSTGAQPPGTQPSPTQPSGQSPQPAAAGSRPASSAPTSVSNVPAVTGRQAPTGGSVASAPPWAWRVTATLALLHLLAAALRLRRAREGRA